MFSHKNRNYFRKGAKTEKDEYQKRMQFKLNRIRSIQNGSNQELDSESSKSKIDLEMKVPKFSETRKKALLFFFIKHFINLAKKSNEFRAYGQSLMLVLQSQNMLALLEEMGYQETKEFGDYRIELERLRNICRVGTEGYWKVNWGYQDKEPIGRKTSNPMSSFKIKQNLPLPDPPKAEIDSQIPGIETNNEDNRQQTFVEVHFDESTAF